MTMVGDQSSKLRTHVKKEIVTPHREPVGIGYTSECRVKYCKVRFEEMGGRIVEVII